MSDLSYASEKYNATAHGLATHPGRVQERLLSSFLGQGVNALPSSAAPPGDSPHDLLERLRATGTSGPNLGDGTLATSILAMTDGEAVEVAR